MKELVAQRVPPGDRWALLNDDNDVVFGSLMKFLWFIKQHNFL